MEKGAVFPLFYLPNVEFFNTLRSYSENGIFLENKEHYPKQTFRNRTVIAGPNGKLELSVPIKKGRLQHTPYKDIRISNDDDWQRIHWLSLGTSYRSSAYFEFYEDDFAPFYQQKFNFLFDYNLQLLEVILKSIKMKVDYKFTEEYHPQYNDKEDFRSSLNIRKPSAYQTKKYHQVFEDRNPYLNNICILDLLFNQGPQASKFF
ncbi:WbqC family protein [Pedobacter sp. SD-b]|uniref:WbqC family protein n=1 Tax=Pedobacter segetis TaxID=2793069 RepID=A0ABS1BIA1_9SPHI|nr:WbqC family protein [Pedobacter segetis]MBK0382575.1 WbqC family protein [Pedobacter segetis]